MWVDFVVVWSLFIFFCLLRLTEQRWKKIGKIGRMEEGKRERERELRKRERIEKER